MRAGWVAGGVLVLAAAGVGGLTLERTGEALPGTTVAGTDVGGLERAGVRSAVERLAATRTRGALPVTAAGVRGSVPRDVLQVDVDATVQRALDDGGSPWGRLLRRGGDVALVTTTDSARLRARLDALAEDVDRPPSGGALRITGVQVAAVPPTAGRRLEPPGAAEAVTDALEQGAAGPTALPVTTLPAAEHTGAGRDGGGRRPRVART